MAKIMASFLIAAFLMPSPFLQAAKKILASSGWNNNIEEGTCITKPWVEKRKNSGEFEREGFKYAEYMDLPNSGRDTMQKDVYAVADHINGELNDAQYENIEAFELLGHSKGGVAVNNLAKIIANPGTEEYAYLEKNCPELMARWKENDKFIENVVTCNAPMDGTFDNIINIANAPTLTAGMVKDYARETKTTHAVANLGALDLAKVPVEELGGKSRIDYFNAMKDGPAYRTHLSARLDEIVPLDSSSRNGKGHNVLIEGSSSHGSLLRGDNPKADAAIYQGFKGKPGDTSDYNRTPVAMAPILKDVTLDGAAGLLNKTIKKYDVPIYASAQVAVKTLPAVKQAVEKGKTIAKTAADKTVATVKTAGQKTAAFIKKTKDAAIQAAVTAAEKTKALTQKAAEITVTGAKKAAEKSMIVLESTARTLFLSQTVLSPFPPYMSLVQTLAVPQTAKSGTGKSFVSRFTDGVKNLFAGKSGKGETSPKSSKTKAVKTSKGIQWTSLDEVLDEIDSGDSK